VEEGFAVWDCEISGIAMITLKIASDAMPSFASIG
jgi:hypothetical protein